MGHNSSRPKQNSEQMVCTQGPDSTTDRFLEEVKEFARIDKLSSSDIVNSGEFPGKGGDLILWFQTKNCVKFVLKIFVKNNNDVEIKNHQELTKTLGSMVPTIYSSGQLEADKLNNLLSTLGLSKLPSGERKHHYVFMQHLEYDTEVKKVEFDELSTLLTKHCRDKTAVGELVFAILQIAYIISKMEDAGIKHCDLHAKNFILQKVDKVDSLWAEMQRYYQEKNGPNILKLPACKYYWKVVLIDAGLVKLKEENCNKGRELSSNLNELLGTCHQKQQWLKLIRGEVGGNTQSAKWRVDRRFFRYILQVVPGHDYNAFIEANITNISNFKLNFFVEFARASRLTEDIL
jgi:hypothetical protein